MILPSLPAPLSSQHFPNKNIQQLLHFFYSYKDPWWFAFIQEVIITIRLYSCRKIHKKRNIKDLLQFNLKPKQTIWSIRLKCSLLNLNTYGHFMYFQGLVPSLLPFIKMETSWSMRRIQESVVLREECDAGGGQKVGQSRPEMKTVESTQ